MITQVNPSPYASLGSFGTKTGGNLYWNFDFCRDRFQHVNSRYILEFGFLFKHKLNVGENVVLFLKEIENTLKLKKKFKFFETTIPRNVLHIMPSEWWLENLVRRSFLTFACRAGQRYTPGADLIEVFKRNKYGKNTIPAVKMFLSGYTRYKKSEKLNHTTGWNRLLRLKKEDDIKTILSKRRTKEEIKQKDCY